MYGRTIWVLTRLASYQLLDLYVGIIFVIFFNSDSMQAELLEGFYWFAGYCIISLVCSELLAGAFPKVALGPGEGCDVYDPELVEPTDDLHLLCGATTPTRASDLPGFTQIGMPKKSRGRSTVVSQPDTEAMTVCFFSAATIALTVCAAMGQSLLEVRVLWSGIVVDHSAHSIVDIVLNCFSAFLLREVSIIIVLMNLVIPAIYMLVLLIPFIVPGIVEPPVGEGSVARVCNSIAEYLRPWATTDVFILASLIFLLTMQDRHTVTLPPEGSYAFYVLLGAGLSFFFLRWFSGGPTARSKLAPLIAVWGMLCLLILRGVPGAHPQLSFPTLSSICSQTLPVVDTAVRHSVPAAFGDCFHPTAPQPCSGEGFLMNTTTDDGFVQAIWMSGLDTIKLDGCRLWRENMNSTMGEATPMHLAIEGTFKHLNLFLHLKQCGPFGCTNMNSADHCCGDDIRFRLTFGMHCRPGRKVLRDVGIESCAIDPMLIRKQLAEHSWYNVAVDTVDISPQVEHVVRDMIRNFMSATQIFWAGRRMHLTDWLNLIVAYNSPSTSGQC